MEKFTCCGGNDDTPRDHTMDCESRINSPKFTPGPYGAEINGGRKAILDTDDLPIAHTDGLENEEEDAALAINAVVANEIMGIF